MSIANGDARKGASRGWTGWAASAVVALLLATAPTANAQRSGGLVGNGAGLSEANVVYAYQILPSAIDLCLAVEPDCAASEKDRRILQDIARIVGRRQASADLIRFRAGHERNEDGRPIFETDERSSHRLAVTGNGPSFPTFWNLNQLYLPDGSPSPAATDIAYLAGIWLHEFGHQVGEPDHVYLDGLASRLRLRLRQRGFDLAYEDLEHPAASLVMTGISYARDDSRARLFVRDGLRVHDLGQALEQVAVTACGAQQGSVVGWDLFNAHWAESLKRGSSESRIVFGAWMNVRCRRDGAIVRPRVEARIQLSLAPEGDGSWFRLQRAIVTRVTILGSGSLTIGR